MKKTRLIALIMVMVLAVSLISSCSIFGGKEDVEKLINADAEFKGEKVYSTMSPLSFPTGYEKQSTAGALILFKDNGVDAGEVKHVVYNVENGQNVKEFFNSDSDISLSVSVGSVSGYTDTVAEYISVVKTDRSSEKTAYTSELYDENGNLVASASIPEQVSNISTVRDLILFNGKAYGISADGKLVERFAYNGMGKTPVISTRCGDYYYGSNSANGRVIYAYDSELKLLFAHKLPAYVDGFTYVPLADGDVFVQYTYVVDTLEDKYDFLEDGTKYNYATYVVSIKDGDAKEVKCDYVIENAQNISDYADETGLSEEIAVFASARKVEDDRLSNYVGLSINEKGKVKELGEFDGKPIISLDMVASNRYVVRTDDGTSYLIDSEGALIGDVTNVDDIKCGYIIHDSKIYDFDLNLLFDYATANLTRVDSYDNNYIMFRDEDGYYSLYKGGSSPVPVTYDKDDTAFTAYFADDYYTVSEYDTKDYEYKFTVYNANGIELMSKSGTDRYSLSENVLYSNSDLGIIIVALRNITDSENTYYIIK